MSGHHQEVHCRIDPDRAGSVGNGRAVEVEPSAVVGANRAEAARFVKVEDTTTEDAGGRYR